MTDIEQLEVTGMAPDYSYLNLYDMPLYSEILPGLWLGGTDDDDVIMYGMNEHQMQYSSRDITKKDFDTVITLYAHARAVDWHVDEVRYGYMDAGIDRIDFERLNRVAQYGLDAWKNGNRVLVRCQAGLNRSSLTMALLLMKDGYTAEDAIHLMRSKRSGYVLFNKSFEKYLLGLDQAE